MFVVTTLSRIDVIMILVGYTAWKHLRLQSENNYSGTPLKRTTSGPSLQCMSGIWMYPASGILPVGMVMCC